MNRYIAALMVIAGACRADLRWEETEIILRARAGEKEIPAEFRFRNEGDQPVRITSVDASCGCVAVDLERREWKTGEGGSIKAVFHPGGREGRQEKTIAVTTDNPSRRETLLKLIVELPVPVVIRPQFIFWRRGEQRTAKEVSVVIDEPETVKLQGVTSTSTGFSAALVTDVSPKRFKVTVAPESTDEACQGSVQLKATVGDTTRVFVIHTAVK